MDKNERSGFHLSLQTRFQYRRPRPCAIMHEHARTHTIVHDRAHSRVIVSSASFSLTNNFVFARRLTPFSTRRLALRHNSTAKTSTQPAENKVRAHGNEFTAMRDRAQSHANVHDRARTDTIVHNSTSSCAIVHNRVCLRTAVNSFSLACILVFAVTWALN